MKPLAILAAGAFVLAACANGAGPDPDMQASGGAAGDFGPGYCDTPPSNPEDQEQWNNQCLPGR